ncbi:sugar phosphate isomerase/epimerase family protein [Solicola gregarius]|uniref:Sugar phosphate isomerase/epimerase n=1 Tax=Solicola gregarius TaxID=2908642 RepID=A0AA46YLH7_9ACTN|nr:sugar phosphate isomerase/epimerase [Solicola gregarius]UYM06960.1 sugar phosphate isomerase/epimerase [Solicola gregarius]
MQSDSDRGRVVGVPEASVSLSTSSVYPEPTAAGFELATRLGYDGVEVMVGIDATSQDLDAVRDLREFHGIPVVSVHAPCLLITQRVWGLEPWGKLVKSAEMAHELDADVVVVHPPFRWQREYGRAFVEGIADLEEETGMTFAVENMYPWRTARREFQAYVPGWNPVEFGYEHVTLDVSHTATAGADPVEMAEQLGDRLAHVHMTDGLGSAKDEHLVPGRGTQPCAELLELLAERNFGGHVVVEINTRRCNDREERETDLAEALAFTRLNLVAPARGGEAR